MSGLMYRVTVFCIAASLSPLALGGCDEDFSDLATNSPPTATPTAKDSTVAVHGPATITLQATAEPGASLTFRIIRFPNHGTVMQSQFGSPTIVFTPDTGFTGSDEFQFYVVTEDFRMSANATIHLTITKETPPTGRDLTLSGHPGQPISFSLPATDDDGDPLTYTVTSRPSGTLTEDPPNYVYTPVFTGNDVMGYSVSDGQKFASGTVTFQVTRVETAPVATPQQVPAVEDTPLTITLDASDADGDFLQFTIWDGPGHGRAFISGNQVFYTPAQDYSGPDSFTYIVSDGLEQSPLTKVDIQVAAVNDPPVISSQDRNVNEDTSTTFQLQASDAENDTVTLAIAMHPKHGTVTDPVGNPASVTYTPDHDFAGTDSFTYTASDGQTTVTATVTMNVLSINDPPVASDITVPTSEDTAVTFQLPASDVDTPAASLRFTIITRPVDGTLTVMTSGSATYTPAPNTSGTRTVKFSVSDGSLSSNVATATIQIAAIADPPVASDDWVGTDLDTPLTIDALANDSDVDGDALTISGTSPPSLGTVAIVAGKLIYTPDAGASGTDVFTYTAQDPSGLTSTATIHVGVGAFPTGAPAEGIPGFPDFPSGETDRTIAISGDGRYLVLQTTAALVSDDTNGVADIYVYDRGTRTIARVSVASDGTQANGASLRPQITPDGRYVVFESAATNLVAGDGNGKVDVFRRDRRTGETLRVSVASSGGEANGNSTLAQISDDGSVVAFLSTAFNLAIGDANGAADVFVRDLTADATTRINVSPAGGDADLAATDLALSGNGQFVAFASAATNLVAGDTNLVSDVFVRDRRAGTTLRASVTTNGGEANAASTQPSISADGQFVSFLSTATNLVTGAPTVAQAYVRNQASPTTIRPVTTTSAMRRADLSADGKYIATYASSILVVDRVAGTSAVPSSSGSASWPVIASGGRYIAMVSVSGQLVVSPNPL